MLTLINRPVCYTYKSNTNGLDWGPWRQAWDLSAVCVRAPSSPGVDRHLLAERANRCCQQASQTLFPGESKHDPTIVLLWENSPLSDLEIMFLGTLVSAAGSICFLLGSCLFLIVQLVWERKGLSCNLFGIKGVAANSLWSRGQRRVLRQITLPLPKATEPHALWSWSFIY